MHATSPNDYLPYSDATKSACPDGLQPADALLRSLSQSERLRPRRRFVTRVLTPLTSPNAKLQQPHHTRRNLNRTPNRTTQNRALPPVHEQAPSTGCANPLGSRVYVKLTNQNANAP